MYLHWDVRSMRLCTLILWGSDIGRETQAAKGRGGECLIGCKLISSCNDHCHLSWSTVQAHRQKEERE